MNKELNMINVNITAVHILTKLFLKDFVKRDSGYILNVSSSAAFQAGPLMATYYGTKAYVLRLTTAIYEELRKLALNVPKYGNDNDYVDHIAVEVSNFYYHEVKKYKDIFGSPFTTAFMGISNYIPTGRIIGATPDGRYKGQPITEGVSPYAGTDTETPLAAMKSAAKIQHDFHSGGTLLNLRFSHDLVSTPRGLRNLASTIQSYFALGAFHVQFNTVSNEILKKAQEHPEQYKDLLVRVAGYSTQFVNLSKEMQDAIMARNAHESF